ncbi:MAG: kelch repeat-containing protein [Candidatus Dormibacteraeota bacterium]|nr:kelch repeat-containing protein [Candidatus Dormibacteraeota bacterium]
MKRFAWLALTLLSACGSPAATNPVPSPSPSASATPSPSPLATASATTIPLGRWASAMAYDDERHNVILFGGMAGQAPLGDTWTWNGVAWSHRQGLTVNPSARQGGAMAFDEVNRQVVLFGGLAANGQMNDTWVWNGNAWQLQHPGHSPPAREGSSMAFHQAIHSIVLYGGMNQSTPKPSAINDTWAWNGNDWSQLQPAASPAGGVRPRLAALNAANLVARFGDCIESHDNALYTFDGHTWSQRAATGSWPPALCLPSFAGDFWRGQLVLFGGNRGTGAPGPAETWTYDGTAWQKVTPAQSPPARYDAPMVFDPDKHRIVLFGGQGLGEGQSGPLNDTWTWDGTAWTLHQ